MTQFGDIPNNLELQEGESLRATIDGFETFTPADESDIPDISGKANLSGGNTFNGDQTIEGGLILDTTTGSIIVPRMNTSQMNSLTGINGMLIYNNESNFFNFRSNGSWRTLVDNGRDQSIGGNKNFLENIRITKGDTETKGYEWTDGSVVYGFYRNGDEHLNLKLGTVDHWFRSNGSVGFGVFPSTGVKLDLSGNQGQVLRLPMLTTTQRDALTPLEGMLFYNTSTAFVQLRDSSSTWVSLVDNSRAQTIGGQKYFSSPVLPLTDNSISVGATGARFSSIWSANGTIQTSDARQKTEVEESDLGLDFINRLNPVSYKWIVGENVVTYEEEEYEDAEGNTQTRQIEIVTPRKGIRRHYGLLAQELEEALQGKDFGGLIIDENGGYGIRYDQLIPTLIKAVQELSAIVMGGNQRLD